MLKLFKNRKKNTTTSMISQFSDRGPFPPLKHRSCESSWSTAQGTRLPNGLNGQVHRVCKAPSVAVLGKLVKSRGQAKVLSLGRGWENLGDVGGWFFSFVLLLVVWFSCLVWFGLVLVWFGLVWFGLVWFGLVGWFVCLFVCLFV